MLSLQYVFIGRSLLFNMLNKRLSGVGESTLTVIAVVAILSGSSYFVMIVLLEIVLHCIRNVARLS